MAATPSRIGRYVLHRPLGRGGMGEVWEAELVGPAGFRKRVALKLLRTPDDREALMEEARLGALLSHPNVVSTLELGHAEGRWFVAMELVDGITAAALATPAPLPPTALLTVGIQACAGLAHIHDLRVDGRTVGLVHRDVKPQNLLVDRTGLVKVADFGISALAGGGHAVIGTPGYMPPEQLQGRAVPASDVFALGATLWRLATGRSPLGKGQDALDTLSTLATRLAHPQFARPVEDVLPGLGPILARCLDPDPDARYPTAQALGAALRALEAGRTPDGAFRVLLHQVLPDTTGDVPLSARGDATTRIVTAPPPHNLPAALDRFVGRADDQARLVALLDDGARLVTLVGPGGLGKTRLAVETARTLTDRFGAGTWFCDASEARTAAGLCAVVSRALQARLGATDPVTTLAKAFASRGPTLLILDNLEQAVAPAASTVSAWLEAAEDLTIIATSRIALRIRGEQRLAPDPLEGEDGVDLFEERANTSISEADREVVRTLVSQLDGLPLAIELAAARARVLGPATLLARMDDRLKLLSGGTRGAPERQATLRGAIQSSWDLLAPWARTALAQLSVFADGWTLEAAEAVLSLPGPEAPWALDVLEHLCEVSMIRVDPEESRFSMLLSIQAFAAEQLEDREAAERRHGEHYARWFSDEGQAHLRGPGGPARARAVTRDTDNLFEAAHRAVARGDPGVATPVSIGLLRLLVRQGPYHAADKLIPQVLPILSPVNEARVRAHYGFLLHVAGRPDEACEHLAVALHLSRETEQVSLQAVVLSDLGVVYSSTGRFEEAWATDEKALALFRRTGPPRSVAVVLGHLGATALRQGRVPVALDYYRKAEAMHLGLGNARSVARVRGHMGLLFRTLGELDEADAYLRMALAGHRAAADLRGQCEVIGTLALVAADRGHDPEAEATYNQALRLARRLGSHGSEATLLGNLGVLYQRNGDFDRARRAYDDALVLHRRGGDRISEALVTGNMGELAMEEGDLDSAKEHLDRAIHILDDAGSRRIEGAFRAIRADVLLRKGDPEGAAAELDRAVAQLEAAGAQLLLADALMVRARMVDEPHPVLDRAERLLDAVGAGPDAERRQRLDLLRRIG